MSTCWTPPETLAPEIELLVRRWKMPLERAGDVTALFEAQQNGATALRLSSAAAFGMAATADISHSAADRSEASPLVILEHAGEAYLQSWRYYEAERTIARELLQRAVVAPTQRSPAAVDPSLNAQQQRAIDCALSHQLALITGGPGTGKTYTLARLLALQLAAGAEPRVIQLAAPTGKAAERMREAVEAAADGLPDAIGKETKNNLKRVAAGACTLHRLLGANPANGSCRFDAEHRLPCRILIVDECSMVDTLQWRALLTALRRDAQLVLVGDPHQLESVRAGDVLGSLVRFGRSHPVLGDVWVELTESRRFQHRPRIGALAEAVVNLRPDAAVLLLQASTAAAVERSHAATDRTLATAGLTYLGDAAFDYPSLPLPVREAVEAVAFAADPASALAALNRVRFLAAHREHSFGVAGVNAAIQQHLETTTRAATQKQAEGVALPIIINRNDPETRLSNGTVGVILSVNGIRRAYFPAAAATEPPRSFAFSQLPDHSPAWAMTIHRSQGSEFDHVIVYLPRDDSPLATRELLYTAITRAKDHVYLSGPESTLRSALTARALRCTLLERALGWQCDHR